MGVSAIVGVIPHPPARFSCRHRSNDGWATVMDVNMLHSDPLLEKLEPQGEEVQLLQEFLSESAESRAELLAEFGYSVDRLKSSASADRLERLKSADSEYLKKVSEKALATVLRKVIYPLAAQSLRWDLFPTRRIFERF